MTGLVVFALYLIAAAYTARAFTVRATHAWLEEFSTLNEGDRRMHAAAGVGVGLVWPGYWVGRLLTGTLMASVPPTDKELLAERAANQRRIADLERELGIGGPR